MTEITSFLNIFNRGTYNCYKTEGQFFKTKCFLQTFDGLFLRTERPLSESARDLQELNVPRPKLFKKFVISVKGIYEIICLYLHNVSH